MRVLLIEDDHLLAQSVERILKRDGVAVDLVTDGEAAERYATAFSRAYDLVLLDLQLPKRDGIEVCRRLRQAKISIPILVMSGRSDTNTIVTALDSGADDYMSKPFPMAELQARMRALQRRPLEQQKPTLSHGELLLNPNTHRLYYKDKEIALTPKEYNILEYFMRRPDQVLTRAQIIDHVWDFAFDSFSNLVDVHIKNIRKKLAAHGCTEVMKTVRGVGYKL